MQPPGSHKPPPPESSLKNEKRVFLDKYAGLRVLAQKSTWEPGILHFSQNSGVQFQNSETGF